MFSAIIALSWSHPYEMHELHRPTVSSIVCLLVGYVQEIRCAAETCARLYGVPVALPAAVWRISVNFCYSFVFDLIFLRRFHYFMTNIEGCSLGVLKLGRKWEGGLFCSIFPLFLHDGVGAQPARLHYEYRISYRTATPSFANDIVFIGLQSQWYLWRVCRIHL